MRELSEASIERIGRLSDKERECLRLVYEHLTSKHIAQRLGIGKTSVDTYIVRACSKLDVNDRKVAASLLAQYERGASEPAMTLAPAENTQAPVEEGPDDGSVETVSQQLWRVAKIAAAAALVLLGLIGAHILTRSA